MNENELIAQGIQLKNDQQYAEAAEVLNQVLAFNNANKRAYYHLALVAQAQQDISQAIAYYKKAIEVDAGYYKAWNNLGQLYKDQSNYEEAIKCYQKAIQVAPEEIAPLFNLAMVLFAQQAYRQALEKLTQVLNFPDQTIAVQEQRLTGERTKDETGQIIEESWLFSGHCHLNLRSIDQAKACYQHLVEKLNPQHVVALNQLGFIALEVTHQEQEAVYYIDRALALDPNFRPAVQNKGLILKGKGMLSEAAEYLKKAIELEPENVEGYYNLACIYSRMQDEAQTQLLLKKALQRGAFLKNYIGQDKDFEAYYQKAWFQAMRAI